jgi:hypothetical protein
LNLIPTASGGVEKNGMDIGKGGWGDLSPKGKTKQRIEQASILLESDENVSL